MAKKHEEEPLNTIDSILGKSGPGMYEVTILRKQIYLIEANSSDEAVMQAVREAPKPEDEKVHIKVVEVETEEDEE